ncbi:MAG: TetR/AcrR family transcriptional regulator [Chloroflexi bacterium]|nr:MAG: TetR/AcrR family transcriptional regulator [Chloroflexota bacterium]MBL1196715.1 TetR/AcrR family transcriptional regulator [Chloroflexota bacterium]NOH14008.1 TetR/AcrR family transcriptional regulator [Chloroflexota bacterium]
MTNKLPRRERQLIERENLILETARGLIRENGFLSLKMSQLAEAVEYSVGTLYTHFETKEDLLVSLAVQSISQRANLFEKAQEAKRKSRDRIYGILIARLMLAETGPEIFDIERLAASPSVWKRATQERYQKMVAMEQRCSEIVLSIIVDAISEGDLALGSVRETDIVFGLWSLTIGFHRLMLSFDDLSRVGVLDINEAVKINYCILLDSYGWQPLKDWDHNTVEKDFRENVLFFKITVDTS